MEEDINFGIMFMNNVQKNVIAMITFEIKLKIFCLYIKIITK